MKVCMKKFCNANICKEMTNCTSSYKMVISFEFLYAWYHHKVVRFKLHWEAWSSLFIFMVSKYDVLLTVHLSIILATDQLNAQILVLW